MSYDVYDAETTIRNNKVLRDYVVGKMKASPYHPDNYIVVEGWRQDGINYTTTDIPDTVPSTQLLVGQNIKFDLLYMLRYKPKMMEWIQNGGQIWCTMLAEYLLTGQQSKFASLDDLARKYGGTLKDDKPKEFWEQNIDTPDIPMDILVPYLEGDIENTDIVYQAQIKKAEQLGMMPLLESQMEALLCTTLMEYNGMAFDKKTALIAIDELSVVRQEKLDKAVSIMEQDDYVHESFVWNPLSNQQLATYLFGGEVKYKTDEPMKTEDGELVRFKTGKRKGEIKTKKTEQTYFVEQKIDPVRKAGANGFHPVGDEVLKDLPNLELIELVKELRDLQKKINTYFKGYSDLVWTDGMIHGTLNHTKTETGRLSSSSPNLQNISN